MIDPLGRGRIPVAREASQFVGPQIDKPGVHINGEIHRNTVLLSRPKKP